MPHERHGAGENMKMELIRMVGPGSERPSK